MSNNIKKKKMPVKQTLADICTVFHIFLPVHLNPPSKSTYCMHLYLFILGRLSDTYNHW